MLTTYVWERCAGVDVAYVVGKHEGTGLNKELSRVRILGHASGETCSGRGLAGCVDGAGQEGDHVFEELRFRGRGIAHNADVDIATQFDSLRGGLVHPTKQHQ